MTVLIFFTCTNIHITSYCGFFLLFFFPHKLQALWERYNSFLSVSILKTKKQTKPTTKRKKTINRLYTYCSYRHYILFPHIQKMLFLQRSLEHLLLLKNTLKGRSWLKEQLFSFQKGKGTCKNYFTFHVYFISILDPYKYI